MEIHQETRETITTFRGEFEGLNFWAQKSTYMGGHILEGEYIQYQVKIYSKLKRSVKEKVKRRIVEHLIKIYGK